MAPRQDRRPSEVDAGTHADRHWHPCASDRAQPGLWIDPQTMSFDAYNKFIEDLFLNGQTIDPKTDGRPDPRGTAQPVPRETALPTTTPGANASLLFDFNFNRTSNFDPPTVAPTPTSTVLATSTPPVPDTTWCNS